MLKKLKNSGRRSTASSLMIRLKREARTKKTKKVKLTSIRKESKVSN